MENITLIDLSLDWKLQTVRWGHGNVPPHILLFFLLKVIIVCISRGEQVGGRVLIADWLDAACFHGNVIWLYTESGSMEEGRIYLASVMLWALTTEASQSSGGLAQDLLHPYHPLFSIVFWENVPCHLTKQLSSERVRNIICTGQKCTSGHGENFI